MLSEEYIPLDDFFGPDPFETDVEYARIKNGVIRKKYGFSVELVLKPTEEEIRSARESAEQEQLYVQKRTREIHKEDAKYIKGPIVATIEAGSEYAVWGTEGQNLEMLQLDKRKLNNAKIDSPQNDIDKKDEKTQRSKSNNKPKKRREDTSRRDAEIKHYSLSIAFDEGVKKGTNLDYETCRYLDNKTDAFGGSLYQPPEKWGTRLWVRAWKNGKENSIRVLFSRARGY
jgi:hypothetical protein